MALTRSVVLMTCLILLRARDVFNDGEPVLARQVAGLCQDFDHISVAQSVSELDDAPVDLGAGAGVAHVGVNGVGEVDGRGVAWKSDDAATRREGIDFLG